MKGALQLAKVAGIPVRVHWTFGLLLLWVVYISISGGLNLRYTLLSIGIVGVVFLCVVLHEYGHALTARRFGVHTRDIILSPIGGIARLEFIPEKPIQEILIAIAGPAVNLVIATVLLLTAWLVIPEQVNLGSRSFWTFTDPQSVIILIAKINLILLVFNLTPAFPMDGGRVLRAALAIPFDRLRATQYAGFLGQAIGLFLFSAGMFEVLFGRAVYVAGFKVSDLVLSFIGIFVFLAARREIQSVKVKSKLKHTSAGEFADPRFLILPVDQPIVDTQLDIPGDSGALLTYQGRLQGVLFREFLEHARKENIPGAVVGNYASDMYTSIDAGANLNDVLEIFQQNGYRLCPVYDGEEIRGIITRKALATLVAGR